jgi:hypothetical protein
MIRKTTLAVSAIAFALTLFASVDSASQAFAKGGMGGNKGKMGMGRERRDHFRRDFRKDFRYNRYWDRFSFGYPCYGCVEAPVCGCEVVAQPIVAQPVVAEPVVVQPVVAQPVVVEVPVCTTCAPVVTVGDSYGRDFGFRHDRRDFRRGERPLEHGGRMGGKKK